MTRPSRRPLRFLAALTFGAGLAFGVSAAPVKSAHVDSELVAQGEAAPGGETYVALVQHMEPGWHTYWRNPGSAGEATQVVWTLPAGWKAGPIIWATPSAIPVGPLVSYAYENEVVLPIAITVPASARPGTRVTLRGEAAFLSCKEVCVPGQASLSVDLVVAGQPAADPKWGPVIARALADAPKPSGLKAVFQRDGGMIKLAVTGAPAAAAAKSAYVFAFDGALIDAGAAQPVERGPQGLTLTLKPEQGAAIKALAGVISIDGKGYEIAASEGAAPPGAAGFGPLKPVRDDQRITLPLAALLALLGGLILNLMPCVFPVLSMKGVQLAAHAHEPGEARKQGLAFLIGVLATFLILAAALLAVRAAGAAVGWGFQLQSPPVVAGLALLMLLIALNLFGAFEIGTSVQGVGGGLSSRSGVVGAALTGAVAVIVAAPCTAPFMAGALGYAVTRPWFEALIVFTALGIGFALPFTALSFAPGLLRRLPRPGPWMATFRTMLAFPMLGAAAWLAWVFAAQAGNNGLAALFASALLIAFAAWLFGRGQVATSTAGRIVQQVILPLALIATVFILAPVAKTVAASPEAGRGGGAALPAEVWTPDALALQRAQGKVVLVDFTAAWCITCQVNEGAALSSAGIAETFAKAGAVYMKADWTNRNAVIAAELAKYGRAGVPLYLVYPAGGGEPKVLPQLLTEGLVREAIEAAAAS